MEDLIIMYLFLIIAIFLAFRANYYLNKIKKFVRKDPKLALRYGEGLITGIVSGSVVLILDRLITPIFKLDFTLIAGSLKESIFSAIGMLILIFFDVTLLFFLVFYIINKGIKKK
ncbi:hypothetical protein HN695_00060 [Candidatus Woesearchaeota archaeon]|jgi:hypothetical protein|nr:hypothetical protein [Candidatus Woesearchaeota archaeon]MBT5272857.1 hypothetical protein [Candidatus Woesearchaeota archaeon]MBT6041323.1 hypothetical protein [Candidatus Woesearchaeota archaeon]MBT6336403.1 hypothetical protein [Candidatus Woesearchaeota archaeon]MBT7926706.1 hypothetical protein [Candidatus Woesearchaeota archaeon]